jgi:hypothetical protein
VGAAIVCCAPVVQLIVRGAVEDTPSTLTCSPGGFVSMVMLVPGPKFAVTDRGADMMIVAGLALPVRSPDQLAKPYVGAGSAVSWTDVPAV